MIFFIEYVAPNNLLEDFRGASFCGVIFYIALAFNNLKRHKVLHTQVELVALARMENCQATDSSRISLRRCHRELFQSISVGIDISVSHNPCSDLRRVLNYDATLSATVSRARGGLSRVN